MSPVPAFNAYYNLHSVKARHDDKTSLNAIKCSVKVLILMIDTKDSFFNFLIDFFCQAFNTIQAGIKNDLIIDMDLNILDLYVPFTFNKLFSKAYMNI